MTKAVRIAALVALDAVCVNLSFFLAYLLRFEFNMAEPRFAIFFRVYADNFIWLTIIKLAVLFFFGMYGSLWKYASVKELAKVLAASAFATLAALAFMTLIQSDPAMPRSVYVVSFLLDTALFGGARFMYRYARETRRQGVRADIGAVLSEGTAGGLYGADPTRVMLVGAGDAGAAIIREIKFSNSGNKKVVAAIDDDSAKRGQHILGVKIEGGRSDIPSVADRRAVDEIIIAIPSATKREISDIVAVASGTGAKIQILPSMMDLIDGKVSVSALRDLDIEDLLGRDPVELDIGSISGYLKDRVILVTGGGGSIGSELCRQIALYGPRKLIALDIYENTAFELENELRSARPELDFDIVIASVTDKVRMREVFASHRPAVVFHAAAHKHVPLMEFNPEEAIINNVVGAKVVTDLAGEFGAEKFVMISTDKAVNPGNVMGATKRLAEMVVRAAGDIGSKNTAYAAVRFGNVLGSNGSVVPIFRKQIERGGPVTVTDPGITRYFMTIPEAVQLVIQAGAMMAGGEIFILDMGEPVRILNLAENIIRLSGYTPYEDIDIVFTGLRPGEKLHEELSYGGEDLQKTKHEKIFLGTAMEPSLPMAAALRGEDGGLERIVREEVACMTDEQAIAWLKEYLPEYRANN
ncbi:MAG: polysaccharide biosynthesis protein [Clostridiales Family XIII bacterium]|nr:polysaccharide biosynthesis protein [Clostridiales Family XIII bacterium]